MTHVLYLHGFASSPKTAKGQALARLLEHDVASYQVPRLDGGDFRRMTIASMRGVVADAVAALPKDDHPAMLIGSSLGGYLAALVLAEVPRLRGAVLIAPAFEFTEHWATLLSPSDVSAWRTNGTRAFFHYESEREEPLGFAFYESCIGLPPYPALGGKRVVIIHGRDDTTVDHRVSIRFAERTPSVELHLVGGDHRLTEPRHEQLIAWTARDLIARL